jgi:acetyl esterase/lipase
MPIQTPTFKDIQTNPPLGDRGLINIYLPEGEGIFPYILGIHGGGWEAGDRNSYSHFWPRIKPTGIAFVLCSYRVFREAHYPAAYHDIVHLFKWLKRNGWNYRLDSNHCILLGGSAGGHLAMLSGLRATKEEDDICKIKGIVDYCGIMDLVKQYAHDQIRGNTMTSDFMGGTPLEKADAYKEASPINHIYLHAPKLWIAHGTVDNIVPVEQSKKMVSLLRSAGHSPVFMEAKDRKHTMTTDDSLPFDKVEFLFEREMLEFLTSCFY